MKDTVGEIAYQPVPPELSKVSGSIIGAAIEVHRHLGPGLLETVYRKALAHELSLRGLEFSQEMPVTVRYKTLDIEGQRLDLLVEPGVIVELKAVDRLLPIHEAQIISYLRSTGYRLGLLINFNVEVLKRGVRRVVV